MANPPPSPKLPPKAAGPTLPARGGGKLLKAVEIPVALENRVQKVLDVLNKKLLNADPRLARIADTLSSATRVAARDRQGEVDLRLVPLKSWDLLSKAEIILRNEPDWPWLPLQRHGQGVQSLSVIFLFQAFVEHLLTELYEAESSPVLALEEPETHLHPQAALGSADIDEGPVMLPGKALGDETGDGLAARGRRAEDRSRPAWLS